MKRLDDLVAEFGEMEDGGPFAVALRREWMNPEVVSHFTVTGEPQSKSRARVTFKNGRATAFTPRQTQEAEAAIAWAYRQAKGPGPNILDTFGVFAVFFCGTRQRRDVDNMIKLVFDALNGVAWGDDSQVTEVSGRLQRGLSKDQARTEVIIYKTADSLTSTKNCAQCGTPFIIYESTKHKVFCSPQCHGRSKRSLPERSCEQCGATYRSTNPRHCTQACADKTHREAVVCQQCGTEFRAPRSLKRKFCGVPCANACKTGKPRKGWASGSAPTGETP